MSKRAWEQWVWAASVLLAVALFWLLLVASVHRMTRPPGRPCFCPPLAAPEPWENPTGKEDEICPT